MTDQPLPVDAGPFHEGMTCEEAEKEIELLASEALQANHLLRQAREALAVEQQMSKAYSESQHRTFAQRDRLADALMELSDYCESQDYHSRVSPCSCSEGGGVRGPGSDQHADKPPRTLAWYCTCEVCDWDGLMCRQCGRRPEERMTREGSDRPSISSPKRRFWHRCG